MARNFTLDGIPAVGGGPQLSSACTPSSLSQPATPASSAPRSLVARYRGITLPPTFDASSAQAAARSAASSLPWPSPKRMATGPPGDFNSSCEASFSTSAAADPAALRTWTVCGLRSRSTPSGWTTISCAPRLDTAFLMRRFTTGTSFSVSEATTTITRASSISLIRSWFGSGSGRAVRPCIFTLAPLSGPSRRRRKRNASSLVRSCGSEMPSLGPFPLMPAARASMAVFHVDPAPFTTGTRRRCGSLTSV